MFGGPAPVARPFARLKNEGCSGGPSRASIGKHSEVFVAFDVAKRKHAVAIAEGGRTGEVWFLGTGAGSPARRSTMPREPIVFQEAIDAIQDALQRLRSQKGGTYRTDRALPKPDISLLVTFRRFGSYSDRCWRPSGTCHGRA
jgi:hypothetical protein